MRAFPLTLAGVGLAAVGVLAFIGASAMAMSCGESCCSMGQSHQHGAVTDATAAAASGDNAAPAGFANTKCPIMGSPINPSKVTEGLTRAYKGKKVAFCCGGCPGQWDKLTDAQKDAKLQ